MLTLHEHCKGFLSERKQLGTTFAGAVHAHAPHVVLIASEVACISAHMPGAGDFRGYIWAAAVGQLAAMSHYMLHIENGAF